MTAPEQTNELIEEAKELRYGMMLLEKAQRATLVYLYDLIDTARHDRLTELAEAAIKCQRMMQEDIELFEYIQDEIDAFIEGDIDDNELVYNLIPEFEDAIEEDLTDAVDAYDCLNMMREGCREGAAATKRRAEGLLNLGFADTLPATFEEQARKAIEYAREVIAFLAP